MSCIKHNFSGLVEIFKDFSTQIIDETNFFQCVTNIIYMELFLLFFIFQRPHFHLCVAFMILMCVRFSLAYIKYFEG
jgi:hypothetical protein